MKRYHLPLYMCIFIGSISAAVGETIDFEELSAARPDRATSGSGFVLNDPKDSLVSDQYRELGIIFGTGASSKSIAVDRATYPDTLALDLNSTSIANFQGNLSRGDGNQDFFFLDPNFQAFRSARNVSFKIGTVTSKRFPLNADFNVLSASASATQNTGFTSPQEIAVNSSPQHVEITNNRTSVVAIRSNNVPYTIDDVSFDLNPTVHLDFDTPVSRDFQLVSNLFSGKSYYTTRTGQQALTSLKESNQIAVAQEIQNIFDRSNIPIDIKLDETTEPSITVKFAPALPGYLQDRDDSELSFLLGRAYDIAPDSFLASGIDRYDRRKDGETAVFVRSGDDVFLTQTEILNIAETAAHEIAHGFGVRHVNPFVDAGNEVLDSESSTVPRFTDFVTPIVEPPNDGEASLSLTHNPAYHIMRYAVGETAESLSANTSLRPGTWDQPASQIFEFLFDLSEVDISIAGLDIGDHSISSQGEANVTNFLEGSNNFSFLVSADDNLSIFGSSTDNNIVDILFDGLSDFNIGELYASNSGSNFFEFDTFRLDGFRGEKVFIGKSSLKLSEKTATISAVPVPFPAAMLTFALLTLLGLKHGGTQNRL